MCAGCGGLITLRLVLKVLGPNVVVVNAAGCLTMLAAYPYSPLRASWLYTTMGSAPAGAQGVRDALDVLIARGRLPASEDLRVVVLAGDGSTLDIGLSSMSGAIHRGLDFHYICYDNEAFGNTGFQGSSSSPFGSRTATSPAGTTQHKKDLFALWLAHRPPYAATVSAADPVDLAEKVRRSMQFRGPKLFVGLATCPPGWGIDPAQGHHVGKLALDTGIWPLKEAVHGEVRHTYVPDHLKPVEDYLQTQARFHHLFSPQRHDDILATIQNEVIGYWNEVRHREFPQTLLGELSRADLR
ncbi:MAG: pyruvate synthase [Planctomycetes bacterium]|nr:pyruvate synthase [Planctomycetota bacterium]